MHNAVKKNRYAKPYLFLKMYEPLQIRRQSGKCVPRRVIDAVHCQRQTREHQTRDHVGEDPEPVAVAGLVEVSSGGLVGVGERQAAQERRGGGAESATHGADGDDVRLGGGAAGEERRRGAGGGVVHPGGGGGGGRRGQDDPGQIRRAEKSAANARLNYVCGESFRFYSTEPLLASRSELPCKRATKKICSSAAALLLYSFPRAQNAPF